MAVTFTPPAAPAPNPISQRMREIAHLNGLDFDKLSAVGRRHLQTLAVEEQRRRDAAAMTPAKPSNYAAMSPMEKRANDLAQRGLESDMRELLHSLPKASEANRAAIEAQIGALRPHERAAFDDVLRREISR